MKHHIWKFVGAFIIVFIGGLMYSNTSEARLLYSFANTNTTTFSGAVNVSSTFQSTGLATFYNGFISLASSTISAGGLSVTTTVTSSNYVADVGRLDIMSYSFKGYPGTGLYLAGANILGIGANGMSAGNFIEAANVATWNIGVAGTFGSKLNWPSNSVNITDSGITYNSNGHFLRIGVIEPIANDAAVNFTDRLNAHNYLTVLDKTATMGNIGINSSTPGAILSIDALNPDPFRKMILEITSTTQSGTSTLFSITNAGTITASSTILSQLTVVSTTNQNNNVALNYSVSTSGAVFMGGMQLPAGGTNLVMCWQNSGGAVGMLSAQAANCTVSAKRYKDNIRPLENGLESVLQMKPVQYTMKSSGKDEIGFIAEDMARVDKRVVVFNADGQAQTIDYARLTAYLAQAVQEQQKEIDELKSKLGLPVKLSFMQKIKALFK